MCEPITAEDTAREARRAVMHLRAQHGMWNLDEVVDWLFNAQEDKARLEQELTPWKQEFPNWDTLEVAKRIQDLEAEVRMACQDRDDRETKPGEAREALQPFIEHAEKRPMESHWTTWASFDDFAKARAACRSEPESEKGE
ncbi:hypothetical protein LCGC14_0532580 [marine sediment metagenome]|uniref:Uncharacterized protein n=1 Tax=marine sediment metagenome TaxID=412755 RepID=A0A0F9S019_9ZZZZ